MWVPSILLGSDICAGCQPAQHALLQKRLIWRLACHVAAWAVCGSGWRAHEEAFLAEAFLAEAEPACRKCVPLWFVPQTVLLLQCTVLQAPARAERASEHCN
jgi:hypothetical protein